MFKAMTPWQLPGMSLQVNYQNHSHGINFAYHKIKTTQGKIGMKITTVTPILEMRFFQFDCNLKKYSPIHLLHFGM
jgi:hypothetical protein